jgi:hypothetical protein
MNTPSSLNGSKDGRPLLPQDILPDEAVSRLRFDEELNHYRRIDAAVAFIVLERHGLSSARGGR